MFGSKSRIAALTAAALFGAISPASAAIREHFVGLTGGLLMSVIAFSIVFLVVLGLMVMMMLLKVAVSGAQGASKPAAAPAPAAKAAPAPAAPAPVAAVAAQPASDDEAEIVAAIMAAIVSIAGEGARIVSFRPAEEAARTPSSMWRMAGILQNLEGFAE